MATLTITINMDNGAFVDPQTGEPDPYAEQVEVARILTKYAAAVDGDGLDSVTTLFDINGARVGSATVTG